MEVWRSEMETLGVVLRTRRKKGDTGNAESDDDEDGDGE